MKKKNCARRIAIATCPKAKRDTRHHPALTSSPNGATPTINVDRAAQFRISAIVTAELELTPRTQPASQRPRQRSVTPKNAQHIGPPITSASPRIVHHPATVTGADRPPHRHQKPPNREVDRQGGEAQEASQKRQERNQRHWRGRKRSWWSRSEMSGSCRAEVTQAHFSSALGKFRGCTRREDACLSCRYCGVSRKDYRSLTA